MVKSCCSRIVAFDVAHQTARAEQDEGLGDFGRVPQGLCRRFGDEDQRLKVEREPWGIGGSKM